MVILQCRECDSLNLELSDDYSDNISCLDCGNKDFLTYVKLYETMDNTTINLDSLYWIDKEGSKHEFKDMSKEYLKNAIKLLKRTYTKQELVSSALFKGLCDEYLFRD